MKICSGVMGLERTNSNAVRQQLDRILASPGFSRNERLSRFLRFVVEQHMEGKSDDLKESLIAVEVFGRKPDYNPKLDAIVRTEAMRLRSRLGKYYQEEGRGDPIIIELPKGGYLPLFREAGAAAAVPQRRRMRAWLGAAIVVALAAASLAGAWVLRSKTAPVAIAVLPLANLSGDPAYDYFSDGLTDEIIHNLSAIEGLAVRSRTSAFALKGAPRNVRETGKQLAVDYILEGSVFRDSHQLRINARLVRVTDDLALWSGKFSRDVSDVFAIQEEISRGIVNELRLKLGGGRRRYETSFEAYDLYLRARARETLPGAQLDERVQNLEAAIRRDPSFAPAYAALASVYAVRSVQFPLGHSADELSRMRALAEKALLLDPWLAEAHDALGLADAREGQWRRAEPRFRRAIELEPNRSSTYIHFALWFLRVLGRIEEGVNVLRAAERVDPLSADVHAGLGDLLIAVGRYGEAARHCSALPPDDPSRIRCLARVHLGQGKAEKAIQLLKNDPALPSQPLNRGILGFAYALSGEREGAEQMAAASSLPTERALIFAGLGDQSRTLEALEKMGTLGPQRVGVFLQYPELALLRGDPRIKQLREKVGLPE